VVAVEHMMVDQVQLLTQTLQVVVEMVMVVDQVVMRQRILVEVLVEEEQDLDQLVVKVL
jgi:hypothetical protein